MTNNQSSNPIGMEIGQYRILSPLGGGGMATVYRAHQRSMERDVAIKIIKPELANLKDFTARFGREAKMLASLSHAHILKIFDYGQHQDMWYLVMELLSGGSLADHITKGPLSLAFTLRLFDQIASALDYAHRRGIVHRDLKPQNVLLDDAANALLTDFGLAKLVNSTSGLTMTGSAVGTPAYMAPEQWSSGAIDLRADVYSLGIMLFEMLTGELPFEGDTPFRLMHMHVYENPRSLTELKPNTSSDIEYIIARALAKQPDDRFQSAGEMSNALRKAVTGITSSYVAERPSSSKPVSTRNISSAPIDRITLLPYDQQTGDPVLFDAPDAAFNPDRITLLPVDESQRQSTRPPSTPSSASNVGLLPTPPAPFEDTDYIAPQRPLSEKTKAKAAEKARKQRAMNLLTIATVALAVIVLAIFGILFNRLNSAQAALPTAAPTGVALVNTTATLTPTPAPTEIILVTRVPLNAPTITYTPSSTATRRPTFTREPTSTLPSAATRRPVSQPATSVPSSGSASTGIVGTIRTAIDFHAGPGSAHPVLPIKVRVGDQFNIEGKILENGEEWFQVTLVSGAPAWVLASAVEIKPPDTYVPVITPRAPPPRK